LVETTLTVDQITAYRKYWEKHPPTHILAAGFMGYEAPKRATLQEFAAALGMKVPDASSKR
jgi:hypothetical protein